MAAIQEEILNSFLTRLRENQAVDEELVQALRALFKPGRKLKAHELVAVYVAARRDGTV